MKTLVQDSGFLKLRYTREILRVLKPVSRTSKSKLFENSQYFSVASAHFLLKDLFSFFGDQLFERDYFAHFYHEKHIFWCFVTYALSQHEDLYL